MRPLSVVVRTVCDLFAWFMVVFGVYVIVHGHLTPGGGFQGGAVVATFVTLILVAYGGEKVLSWINTHMLDALETSGLLIFLGAGFLGISSAFFYNILANSGGFLGSSVPAGANSGVLNSSGTIALMNVAVGMEVVGGISLIIIFMFIGIRIFEEVGKEERGYDR